MLTRQASSYFPRWLFLVQKVTTPVGFEPTRAEPTNLAGWRLNHSAKVSPLCVWKPSWIICTWNRTLCKPSWKISTWNRTLSIISHPLVCCMDLSHMESNPEYNIPKSEARRSRSGNLKIWFVDTEGFDSNEMESYALPIAPGPPNYTEHIGVK